MRRLWAVCAACATFTTSDAIERGRVLEVQKSVVAVFESHLVGVPEELTAHRQLKTVIRACRRAGEKTMVDVHHQLNGASLFGTDAFYALFDHMRREHPMHWTTSPDGRRPQCLG